MEMKIKRLKPAAVIPQYATPGASGMDLHACIDKPIYLHRRSRVTVPTGLAIQVPKFYEAQVRPRSGWAHKHGLTVLNTPGTVDEDYTGEVGVILINHGDEILTIKPGERIAQLVICPVLRVTPVEVGDLEETDRGAGGFGSTGK